MTRIDKFSGPHAWLSNFHPCDVKYDGVTYPSTEHAYQAAKTLDHKERLEIKKANKASIAKSLGKSVKLRADWDSVKLDIMYYLCYQKFSKNADLGLLLRETGECHIEEGNDWGDRFWGTVKGRGSNHLGKILMRIREDLVYEAKESVWPSEEDRKANPELDYQT